MGHVCWASTADGLFRCGITVVGHGGIAVCVWMDLDSAAPMSGIGKEEIESKSRVVVLPGIGSSF